MKKAFLLCGVIKSETHQKTHYGNTITLSRPFACATSICYNGTGFLVSKGIPPIANEKRNNDYRFDEYYIGRF